MINIGNFFALAQAQVDRVSGIPSGDMTLCAVVPPTYHPTKNSRVREVFQFLPPTDHMRFAAACAWMGRAQVESVIDEYANPAGLEAMARMVDAGTITAPRDAPCRTYPWASIERALPNRKLTTPSLFGRFIDYFGHYTPAFLADVRQLCEEPDADPWITVTPDQAKGLAWVEDDSGLEGGNDLAAIVAPQILRDAGQYWFGMKPQTTWTIDTVVAWAGYCFKYVDMRRSMY